MKTLSRKLFPLTLLLPLSFFVLSSNLIYNDIRGSKVQSAPWRFVVIGDTHIAQSDTVKEMIPFILEDNPDLILVCGDLVDAGRNTSSTELEAQLNEWIDVFSPLYSRGIGIYPVRGNHEDDAADDISVWNKIFAGTKALPQNGPVIEKNLTYSFIHKNAFFAALDNYINIHRVNQDWISSQLSASNFTHQFVFGHEAAFKVFHTDCLDDYSSERNDFWQSLLQNGVRSYFCGHDHFLDAARIDNGDGDTGNDIYQICAGGGGGWIMTRYNYNGSNAPYFPAGVYHKAVHGYVLVEISGSESNDCGVTISFKERTYDPGSNTYKYVSAPNKIQYNAVPQTVSVDSKRNSLPEYFKLFRNYPNPFNPDTVIKYSVPSSQNIVGSYSPDISIKVYDLLGRHIDTLFEGTKPPGIYETRFNAGNLPSGIYICELKAGKQSEYIKMNLIR